MLIDHSNWLNLAVALGVGLLIGAERERRKEAFVECKQNTSSVAGVRTFTIAALLGAVSVAVEFWLLIISIVCVTLFVVSAPKNEDHSLTTHVSLVYTIILGGLAMTEPALSASLAVAVAILLAAKEPIHWFVRGAVTKDEMMDFLILAAATLIVLPLVPNRYIGPFDAINPYNMWLIVILVMFIGALGHLVLRLMGGRLGLPLVGLVSGFISSIATVGAMGERARHTPHLLRVAVAGAILSSLSTILQIVMLLAAIHPPTLRELAIPLLFGGVVITIYGIVVTLSSLQQHSVEMSSPSRSFSVKTALMFAIVITLVLLASATLKAWFGDAGVVIASAVAGMADVHAATISVASLSAANKLLPASAVIPILVAFTVNTTSKVITAAVTGGRDYFRQVTVGLVLQVVAVWLGWVLF